MSSTAVQLPTAATRRHLSARQARTVHALTEAAVAELGERGYGGLTVRGVARRAGVAPATAYTYFGSKEQLVAEVFWRRLDGQEARDHGNAPVAARAAAVLLDFALVVAEETELAAACTVALLADDPDVRDLRVRIGVEMHRRLTEALGDHTDPVVLQTLELATSGALLQVGTGHLAYDALPGLLTAVAELTLRGATR
jgi:AcrR family transcriptional regulator